RPALPRGPAGHRVVVGGGAGQPGSQLPLRRGQHLAPVHRRRARRAPRAGLRHALPSRRASVPHTDAVHRDVRAGQRRAARIPEGVRAAPTALFDAVPGHRHLMLAATIVHCGQPPVVGYRDLPQPGEGQVRVAVAAAPIVPLDVLCASGTSYFGVPVLPYVPGVQGVGTLDDETPVWFSTTAGMRPGDGIMAEYCLVSAADVVRLPDGVDGTLIAALGLSAVAAWTALTCRGE